MLDETSFTRGPTASSTTTETLPAPRRPSRGVPVRAFAGYVGAATTLSASGIEIARAWTAPVSAHAGGTEVLGGTVVALLVLASVGLAARVHELGGVTVASSFGLLAYGVALVLQAQAVGAIFVGLAPIVGMLAHAAFLAPPAAPEPPTSARIDIAWAIAKSRAKARQGTARAAERAASRNLHGMLA
ncbi:MAG: hypothetical protein JWP97_3349 [Labilithrix sp.]|nr:hypothetical protein [Labilithrix sp.]